MRRRRTWLAGVQTEVWLGLQASQISRQPARLRFSAAFESTVIKNELEREGRRISFRLQSAATSVSSLRGAAVFATGLSCFHTEWALLARNQ
jgi:hypothetical protein